MPRSRKIRCYDYVNHPYDQVRAALEHQSLMLFQSATKAAAARARSIASELRVNIAGIEVATDISITLREIRETARRGKTPPSTRIILEWEASKAPRLFPFMNAELSVYPLTATETQLDFSGAYEPPLGALGSALNAIAGHRIAEVSVHRFVADIAAFLRTALSGKAQP